MASKDLASKYQKKFGITSASGARFRPHTKSTSTGILALDQALGTRGWPEGAIVEVYGPRDIGKSSVIGLQAVIEAQKEGKNCAIVAVEPGFKPGWAEKHGVDLDKLVVLWPDNGKIAFDMLFELVNDDDIHTIVFDSIGALLREAEAGDKGKPAQGGQSGLITWGVKRIQMPVWKKHKTVILINQIRDDMGGMYAGAVKAPGGHALEHTAEIHVQLKPGKDRFTVKRGTGDEAHEVMVGRTVIAVINRNKWNEGTNQRAFFDFYQEETEEYPFGVDRIKDTILTAKRVGVIRQGGGWHYHDSFPEGKINGYDKVYAYLEDESELLDEIRRDTRAILGAVPKSPSDDIQDTGEQSNGRSE